MKIVGLTGGIGSGKTTVSKEFQKYSIKVYNSDLRAKFLMNNSIVLKNKLINIIEMYFIYPPLISRV